MARRFHVVEFGYYLSLPAAAIASLLSDNLSHAILAFSEVTELS
jgi:hypothetical protein